MNTEEENKRLREKILDLEIQIAKIEANFYRRYDRINFASGVLIALLSVLIIAVIRCTNFSF